MILNKRFWALVDPTDSFIMWGYEEPFVNSNKRKLIHDVATYGKYNKTKIKDCKIKRVVISVDHSLNTIGSSKLEK